MDQIKEDFSVPYYIFEEVVDYIELKSKGRNKCMKWYNIRTLLNLAVVTNSLSGEQAKYIEEAFCREDKKP